MKRQTLDLSTLMLSLVLLVLATLFSMVINIGSFRQTHASGVMNSYAISGLNSVHLVEQGLRFGKPLDDFHGIERYLKSIQQTLPDVLHVEIARFDGQLLNDETGPLERRMSRSDLLWAQRELAHKQQTFIHDRETQVYRLFLAVRPDPQAPPVAWMVISVKDARIDQVVSTFAQKLLWQVLGIIAGHAVLLLFLWWLAQGQSRGRVWIHLHFGTLSLVVVALAQLGSGYAGYVKFHDEYLASTRDTTEHVGHVLESQFEALVQRGIRYEQLSKVDDYLDGVQKTAPFLSRVDIEAGDSPKGPTGEDETLRRRLPPDAQGQQWTLVISISAAVLQDRLRDIVLDAGAILLTSLMFMFELSMVVMQRSAAVGEGLAAARRADYQLRFGSRFGTFLMYFAMFMSASFVPLVMGSFGDPLPGLSLGQSAAAAISAEMAAGSVALLLTNVLSRRWGAVRVAYGGYACLVVAALLAWQATDPLVFVLARAMTGAGSMWVLGSVYRMIDTIRDPAQRQAAIPDILAGSFAGVNCGAVTGSFLAAQIGTQAVFAAAALVLLVSVAYLALSAIKALPPQIAAAPAAVDRPATGAGRATRRDYLGASLFFALVSAPTAAVSMYLPFYFPVFAAEAGAGSNVIGRAFLINGMCFVFLGPWLAAWARKNLRPAWSVLLSAGLLVPGLILFASHPTLGTAFIVVALMSLGDCFGISSQVAFVASLPLGRRLGLPVVQGYQLNARKVGQIVGPMVFSVLAAYGSVGIGGLGLVLAALLMLFGLLSAATLMQPETPR